MGVFVNNGGGFGLKTATNQALRGLDHHKSSPIAPGTAASGPDAPTTCHCPSAMTADSSAGTTAKMPKKSASNRGFSSKRKASATAANAATPLNHATKPG